MNKKIISIAEAVRMRCEVFAESSQSGDYDFHKQRDLACMCAVASFALHTALKRNGIKTRVAYGQFDGMDHCWIEYRDLIIDITATQFGMSRIHVVNKHNAMYQKEKTFDKYSRFFHWEGQAATPSLTRKILGIKY